MAMTQCNLDNKANWRHVQDWAKRKGLYPYTDDNQTESALAPWPESGIGLSKQRVCLNGEWHWRVAVHYYGDLGSDVDVIAQRFYPTTAQGRSEAKALYDAIHAPLFAAYDAYWMEKDTQEAHDEQN